MLGSNEASHIVENTKWIELIVMVIQDISASKENSYLNSFYHSKINFVISFLYLNITK